MLNNYSDEQLRLAAQLYYVDDMPQAEVAKFVKVSQAKVSRLLSLARERGIVRITVAEYEPRNSSLERQLVKTLGLQSAAVIKVVGDLPQEDTRRAMAHFATAVISELTPLRGSLAISGGRTLREIVHVLPAHQRQLTIVQAMGNIDSQVSPEDAVEIGRLLAARWQSSFIALNTPAFVTDRKTRDAFLAHGQIDDVRKLLIDADVALVGIGTLDNSVFVERGVLAAADLLKLKSSGAVGEICGRFFDHTGKECQSPWSDRVISIELERLRKIPNVIAAVCGSDRSAAILAAIRGRLIKTLIIDEAGAAALLALHDSKARPLKTSSKK